MLLRQFNDLQGDNFQKGVLGAAYYLFDQNVPHFITYYTAKLMKENI